MAHTAFWEGVLQQHVGSLVPFRKCESYEVRTSMGAQPGSPGRYLDLVAPWTPETRIKRYPHLRRGSFEVP